MNNLIIYTNNSFKVDDVSFITLGNMRPDRPIPPAWSDVEKDLDPDSAPGLIRSMEKVNPLLDNNEPDPDYLENAVRWRYTTVAGDASFSVKYIGLFGSENNLLSYAEFVLATALADPELSDPLKWVLTLDLDWVITSELDKNPSVSLENLYGSHSYLSDPTQGNEAFDTLVDDDIHPTLGKLDLTLPKTLDQDRDFEKEIYTYRERKQETTPSGPAYTDSLWDMVNLTISTQDTPSDSLSIINIPTTTNGSNEIHSSDVIVCVNNNCLGNVIDLNNKWPLRKQYKRTGGI